MTQNLFPHIFVRKPRKIIKLDSQQLNALEKCPQLYQLSFIEDLEPRFKAAALRKGSIISNALEAFYQCKIDGDPFVKCVLAAIGVVQSAEYLDEPTMKAAEVNALLFQKISEYCKYYHLEKEIPVAAEKGFSKTLYSDDDIVIIYEGKPDLVFRYPGSYQLHPWDHKSESSERELHSHSNQFLGYVWALESSELVINYVGLQKSYAPKDSFRRVRHLYTKADLTDWVDNVKATVSDSLKYIDNNQFPKKRSACDGKYGLCYFARICDEQDPFQKEVALKTHYKIRETKWSAWG